jgi:hypothetical protein
MSTLLKKIAPSLNVYAAEPITEAMVAAAVSAASTYTIEFDFRSAAEKAILTDLQKGKYQLLAYKGASGPSQVTAGLPTWFAMPFTNIYGDFKVNYTPVYKVYVYNEVDISEDTVITMDALSQEVTLGTALTFQPDGSFKIASSPAQPGAIKLTNNRPGGTTNLTVGLAAKINGVFAPFCAFTITPGGSINMVPHENVCMFAAQTSLQSGSVTASAAAPGSIIELVGSTQLYQLTIEESTFAVIGANGTVVTLIPSDQTLDILNN